MTRPLFVLVGGCLLAFLAAAVNMHFLIGTGVSVSHLTGDLARFSGDAAVGRSLRWNEIVLIALALSGFVLGAAVAGFAVHRPQFALRRPYGRSIVGIGLLCLAAWACGPAQRPAAFLVAAACGLQNGLATHYRGLVLRTTHVTGLLTDLGQMAGMRLAGRRIENWKLAWQGAVVISFAAGAACGALLHLHATSLALLVLGLAYVVGGAGWSVAKRRTRGRA